MNETKNTGNFIILWNDLFDVFGNCICSGRNESGSGSGS